MKSHENNTVQTNNVVRKAYTANYVESMFPQSQVQPQIVFTICATLQSSLHNAMLDFTVPGAIFYAIPCNKKHRQCSRLFILPKANSGVITNLCHFFLLLSSFVAFAQFTLTYYLCLIAEVRFCVCLTLPEVHKSHPLTT